jgi:hypothetical protein
MPLSDKILLLSFCSGILWTLAWAFLRTTLFSLSMRWMNRTRRGTYEVITGPNRHIVCWTPNHAYSIREIRMVSTSRWRWLAVLGALFTRPQR